MTDEQAKQMSQRLNRYDDLVGVRDRLRHYLSLDCDGELSLTRRIVVGGSYQRWEAHLTDDLPGFAVAAARIDAAVREVLADVEAEIARL